MSYIHRQLLKRGRLSDILPSEDDFAIGDMPEEKEAIRSEIEARTAEDFEVQKELVRMTRKLRDLNKKNHYGESIRRAFGGR